MNASGEVRQSAAADNGAGVVVGVGDVGSAVAHRLFRADSAVRHDGPQPIAPRRGMAFTNAVFDGLAAPDGGRSLSSSGTRLRSTGPCRRMVLVDARMRKRAQPECQRGRAGLTIGHWARGQGVSSA